MVGGVDLPGEEGDFTGQLLRFEVGRIGGEGEIGHGRDLTDTVCIYSFSVVCSGGKGKLVAVFDG